MIKKKATGSKRSRTSELLKKRIELRDQLWPDSPEVVWDRTDRKEKGFTTLPRTVPLVGALIRHLTDRLDASRAYFDLWGRSWDGGLVEIDDEEELAASCGYTTSKRNVRTWRERMVTLEQLGFIRIKPRGTRKYGYVLLVHPHDAVQRLRHDDEHDVPEWWWTLFLKRTNEIRAVLRLPHLVDSSESDSDPK